MNLLSHKISRIRNPLFKIAGIFLLLFTIGNLYSQINPAQKDSIKVIDIYNADMLSGYTLNGKSYQKLVGRVVLHHDGAMMFCDSAYC